jgi:hypothetical protein
MIVSTTYRRFTPKDMKMFRYIFFVFLITSLIGCSTIKVNYEYDSGADFAAYQSYDWLPVPQGNINYSHLAKEFKFFMDRQLESKGYKKVSGEPDFMIALHGAHYGFIFYDDYVYLRDNFKPYLERRVQDVRQYEDDLVVDFIDTKTKGVVFRAKVTSHVADIMPERIDESLDETVTRILANFPPVQ